MIPFERAFVISYRLSIVTFPLSLRVSEILPVLCSSTPLFPTPPLVSRKFPHVPLGVGGWPLGYEERRCLANCPCNYFQDFQPMWSWSTNVTDGRTDGRTTCNLNTALVHRAVIIEMYTVHCTKVLLSKYQRFHWDFFNAASCMNGWVSRDTSVLFFQERPYISGSHIIEYRYIADDPYGVCDRCLKTMKLKFERKR